MELYLLDQLLFISLNRCFFLLLLFEVTFLFKFFSLSLKSASSMKSEISALAARFACANLLKNFNLLNSCVAIYFYCDNYP